MREGKPNRKAEGGASARRPKATRKPKDKRDTDVSRVSRIRSSARGGRGR